MRVGAVWLGLLMAAGCAPPAQVRYEERVKAAQPADEHAVHAERLMEVMRGLERLSGERLPKSMDVEWEREWRVEELVVVARAIADSAAQIPSAPEGALLSANERRAFQAYARTLQERASALAETAPELSDAETETRIAGIRQACAACHQRFRGAGSDEEVGW